MSLAQSKDFRGIHCVDFLLIVQGRQFCDLLFAFLHTKPLLKRGPLTRPRGYKTFFMVNSGMKFVLLINLKLLTIANSFLLNIAEHEIFCANKYENANYGWHFHIY